MGNETDAVHLENGGDQSDASSAISKEEEEEVKLLREAVRTLPAHAVKDLLSVGVCVRCIFRSFGVHVCINICALPSLLFSILGKEKGLEGDIIDNCFRAHENSRAERSSPELEMETTSCRICLGILQFVYFDDKGMLVKKDSGNDFAVIIADIVKQECHQIDSFSLEVSLPQLIIENEQALCLYMKNKYGSEPWFQEKFSLRCISTKDVLKLSLSSPLETLLGVKSGLSSFRIRLTYTHSDPSVKDPKITKMNPCNKRRKTGANDDLNTDCGSAVAGLECSNFCNTQDCEFNKGHRLKDHEISNCFLFQYEKVNIPCRLTLHCYRTPIYIGGRYLKYSRNVSQTRWIVDDERMGEASVEEIIGCNSLSVCRGDSYKFHAAGREDIDVRMLGSGRPFLVEILNARHVSSEVLIKEIESKINGLEDNLVRVKSLKVLDSQGWTLMREGEAEKQKEYAALVWISRSLNDEDMLAISSVKDMQILQKTPIRVLHRRSPLERGKIIHWMKIERIAGSSQYFLLHLCTQAGTYIKEFVHGDLGRTHPSLGSMLGCRAEIMQLDVTDVKMDCFLAE